jgi:putative polyhydroxyalkanoate system protein
MPSIEIHRRHAKSTKDAKAAVERVAAKISEKFDMQCGWEGNTLLFERSGVHGEITLGKGEVKIIANLGFLLMALRGTIEAEIHKVLDREFGPSPA